MLAPVAIPVAAGRTHGARTATILLHLVHTLLVPLIRAAEIIKPANAFLDAGIVTADAPVGSTAGGNGEGRQRRQTNCQKHSNYRNSIHGSSFREWLGRAFPGFQVDQMCRCDAMPFESLGREAHISCAKEVGTRKTSPFRSD
jgi:hypothetical protein